MWDSARDQQVGKKQSLKGAVSRTEINWVQISREHRQNRQCECPAGRHRGQEMLAE